MSFAARRYRLPADDRDELRQSLCVRVLESLAGFDPSSGGATLETWVRRHANWGVADYWRSRRRRELRETPAGDDAFDLEDDRASAAEELAYGQEIRSAVEDCLGRLTPTQRERLLAAASARESKEPLHELANRMGVARDTLKEALKRARVALRKCLHVHGFGPSHGVLPRGARPQTAKSIAGLSMDPVDVCLEGIPDETIAALIDDPADPACREHTQRCRVCARRHLDHVAASAALRCVVARGRGTASVPPASRRRWGMPSRLPLAASLLAGLIGFAAAGVVLLVGPLLVGPSGPGGPGVGRVSEMEIRTHLDLRGAGLSDTSAIDGWTTVRLGPSEAGTVVAATVDAARHPEIAAFDADGSVRWTSTARGWPDFAGIDGVFHQGIGTVVTRMDGAAPEERVWAVLSRWNTGALLFADPLTGDLSGTYLHPGWLARWMAHGTRVVTLPVAPGDRRRVVVTGHHHDADPPRLCLSVVEVDGRLVQHVQMPDFPPGGTGATEVFAAADWSPGHESLTIQYSQALVVRIPIEGGRLVTGNATVSFADRAKTVFGATRAAGTDEFDDWLRAKDPGGDLERGRAIALGELARDVREWPVELPTRLGDR